MLFTRAERKDYTELTALFRAASAAMEAKGVFQWDEIYPDGDVIREDIARGMMEVGRIEGRIAVAFLIDYCRAGDYEPANWRYNAPRFAVIHRLCVHPAFQGRGVSRDAMDYIESSARANGAGAVRLDAFSQNPVALHLYESRGYEKAGEITYRKGLFYLYEKKL